MYCLNLLYLLRWVELLGLINNCNLCLHDFCPLLLKQGHVTPESPSWVAFLGFFHRCTNRVLLTGNLAAVPWSMVFLIYCCPSSTELQLLQSAASCTCQLEGSYCRYPGCTTPSEVPQMLSLSFLPCWVQRTMFVFTSGTLALPQAPLAQINSKPHRGMLFHKVSIEV